MFSAVRECGSDVCVWVCLVKVCKPSRRENTHELLERLERLANLECDVHLINIYEVCRKWSEMIWIVPLPRRSLGIDQCALWKHKKSQNILLDSNSATPKPNLRRKIWSSC